ncbi:MAG: Sir2 family NAD-dependent protein deacetylase [Rhodocyclaceae bacterium]|nr:Sir2 family NAD-dependent protein deacetylase [Rhodocyclaceae bacterium]
MRLTGLWAQVDPMEIATPWAFRADPQRTWDWHVQLAEAVRAARPNAGHAAIAALERAGLEVTVITQNIDALHHRAGSREVIELHGNLLRLKSFVDEDAAFAAEPPPVICAVCDGYAAWEACDLYADRTDLAAIELRAGPVPRCPGCGALLRPDVVWFGEPLAAEAIEAAWDAVDRCEALIAVGASLEVEPAASLPWHALRRGARVIEVNPAPTALAGQCHAGIRGAAAEVLPELFASIWPSR